METIESCQSILKTGKTTTERALQVFDALETVNLDFMLGRWQGSGLQTDHPKVDDRTVLGIMDFKNLSQPFFFVLKRCSLSGD